MLLSEYTLLLLEIEVLVNVEVVRLLKVVFIV